MKATSDDASPIPGYLYPEIAKISLESAATCETLLGFLLDRLERNSYHVKLKVLKLMKYVVQNGNPNFAMGLRKRSRGIKEATVYGGPPDPLHGNIPYVLVRKAAKELSEILFDTESEHRPADHGQAPVLKSTGGMGTSLAGRGLEGFGNSPNRPEKTFGEAVRSGLNKLAEKLADPGPAAISGLSATQSCGEYRAAITTHTALTQPITQSKAIPKTRPVPRKHIPGRAGGGWDDDDLECESHPGVGVSSGSRSDDSQVTSDKYESSSSTEDWSTEENFVSEVTEKPEAFLLTRKDICQFLKRCQMVNCEKTIEVLSRTMVGQPDNITVKCLQCIEGLLRADLVSLEYIALTCRDSLVSLHSSPNMDVACKARKIIRILEKLTSHVRILPLHPWKNGAPTGEGQGLPATDRVKQNGVNQPAGTSGDDAETHDTEGTGLSDSPSFYVPAFSGPASPMDTASGQKSSDVVISELSDHTVISESSDTGINTFKSEAPNILPNESDERLLADTDYYSSH